MAAAANLAPPTSMARQQILTVTMVAGRPQAAASRRNLPLLNVNHVRVGLPFLP